MSNLNTYKYLAIYYNESVARKSFREELSKCNKVKRSHYQMWFELILRDCNVNKYCIYHSDSEYEINQYKWVKKRMDNEFLHLVKFVDEDYEFEKPKEEKMIYFPVPKNFMTVFPKYLLVVFLLLFCNDGYLYIIFATILLIIWCIVEIRK